MSDNPYQAPRAEELEPSVSSALSAWGERDVAEALDALDAHCSGRVGLRRDRWHYQRSNLLPASLPVFVMWAVFHFFGNPLMALVICAMTYPAMMMVVLLDIFALRHEPQLVLKRFTDDVQHGWSRRRFMLCPTARQQALDELRLKTQLCRLFGLQQRNGWFMRVHLHIRDCRRLVEDERLWQATCEYAVRIYNPRRIGVAGICLLLSIGFACCGWFIPAMGLLCLALYACCVFSREFCAQSHKHLLETEDHNYYLLFDGFADPPRLLADGSLQRYQLTPVIATMP